MLSFLIKKGDFFMKKPLSLLLITACIFLLFSACNKPETYVIKETDEFVIIKCYDDSNGKKLVEVMDGLDDDFFIKNGMVESINGLENAIDWSSAWMLYTDDEELSNTAWGTIEYQGNVYASAIYGAEELTVKSGCTYVWVYKYF